MRLSEDVITAAVAVTLSGLLSERIRRTPERCAYRDFDRGACRWRELSWAQFGARVAHWQAGLAQEELRPGDRVAVQMRNGSDWVAFEQAALGLGLVLVPLYVDDRPDNVAYILADAAVKVLLMGDWAQWARLAPALGSVTCLRRVLVREGRPDQSVGQPAWPVEDWLPRDSGSLQTHLDNPDGLATIVYTSGTTGRPKGVMLSHRNILTIAHGAIANYKVYLEDVFLSFLPLSHMLERTTGYYVPMMAGASVAFARSVPQLAEDLGTIKPSAMIAVPRIFERVYARIHDQLSTRSVVARALFRLTVAVGWRRFLAAQHRARSGPPALLWPLCDRLVADKVRQRFGGRIRIIVSGGAPLPVTVAKTFIGLGLSIVQGYGLTECSPVVSGNPLNDNDPASVGAPLPGVEVRIGADSELLVRGPGVMLGYWNNPAATAAVLEADGWLHTGDQARIANDHIYITGRIKDVMVLSNGEKVSPLDIEEAITLDPLLEQAMVMGEGRAYLAALVVLEPDRWVRLARELGLDPFAAESLLNARLQRKLLSKIRALMRQFPGYAKVRRLHVSVEPWTVENGLLTPTLKVRRAEILRRFEREIERIYAL